MECFLRASFRQQLKPNYLWYVGTTKFLAPQNLDFARG